MHLAPCSFHEEKETLIRKSQDKSTEVVQLARCLPYEEKGTLVCVDNDPSVSFGWVVVALGHAGFVFLRGFVRVCGHVGYSDPFVSSVWMVVALRRDWLELEGMDKSHGGLRRAERDRQELEGIDKS